MQGLLAQSYDIFNIYGKQPEAMKNILSGFALALQDYTEAEITAAFQKWLKTSAVFPTPADIIGLMAPRARKFRWEEATYNSASNVMMDGKMMRKVYENE